MLTLIVGFHLIKWKTLKRHKKYKNIKKFTIHYVKPNNISYQHK